MPDKKQTAQLLDEIADMMEFKGENPFKVKAFRNGALAIKRSGEDLEELVSSRRLNEIKGIGKGLQSVIYEYFENSRSVMYDELREEVPDGIGELLKIKGLGVKKIKAVYSELGISRIEELEQAAKEGRIAGLKGFGAAAEKNILSEINRIRNSSGFTMLNAADIFAAELLDNLLKSEGVEKAEVTGQLRRGMEVISKVEAVLLVKNKGNYIDAAAERFNAELNGDSLILNDFFEVPVKLYFTETPTEYTQTLFNTTGSEEFLGKLKRNIKGGSEEEIFKKLKMPYVIPEMREELYFEADEKLRQNTGLSINDFKGLLHFHTTYSDGRNSLREMLEAAVSRGFKYAAVCDHSKAAFYANGLKEDAVLEQKRELEKLAKELDITLFHGVESDILRNGELDYDEEFLKNFDFIVASIHSRFGLDEKEMTKRIVKGVENRYTDLLGHPSGRLLLSRDAYGFDTKKVIDACAANDTAIEINSNPRRLDLDWRWIYYARSKGVRFSINPDAHSIAEIDLIKYGIKMAKKGGLQPGEVINCYSADEFRKFLKRKRDK